jgi:hypothetical protein
MLLRGGVIYTSAPLNSDATGLVEVNHPGGTCWNLQTPDMRPGDVIRIVNAAGIAEQTRVANVTAQRPIAINANTVIIHGTAQDANGQPLPLVQVEQRLIANRDLFDLNGRRTLRAGGAGTDGTLTYDTTNNPTGTSWTATYTNLSADDMARAVGGTSTLGTTFVGAESRAVWLGRDPVALTEATIFENGPGVVGGPSAPCTAPAETPVAAATFTPTSLNFGDQAFSPPSTSAPKTVTFSNGGGANMTITAIYLAGLNPGDFTITSALAFPVTLAPGASLNVNVTFSPKALGARQANLSFMDNAANTTDQSVPLTGSGINTQAPSAPGAPAHSLAAGTGLTVLTPIGDSTIPVTLAWTPSTGPLTGYQLQQSLNGGAFADVTPAPGITPKLTQNLAMGTTTAPNAYQFRVRGCNNSNCSAWVLGPKFSTMPIDETNSAFVSFNGTWTTDVTLPRAYGGSVRFATTSKDKAQLPNKVTFTTQGSLAWVAVMGPALGKASVSIDGGAPITVDLYAPTRQLAMITFAANNLAAGRQHSIVVQVLGTKNPASAGTRVDVDAFVLLK